MEKTAIEIFLDGLSENTRRYYENRINDFNQYSLINQEKELAINIINYFYFLHETYLTSTIWSYYSVMKTYLNLTKNIDLKEKFPHLIKLLKQWEKKDEKKKSNVFSKEEIKNYIKNCKDNPESITIKAVLSVAISGLMRTSEINELKFENIKKNIIENTKEIQFEVKINRKKQIGPKALSSFFITDILYTESIEKYINCFANEVIFIIFI